MAHVERPGADLRRGGHRHGRSAGAAGALIFCVGPVAAAVVARRRCPINPQSIVNSVISTCALPTQSMGSGGTSDDLTTREAHTPVARDRPAGDHRVAIDYRHLYGHRLSRPISAAACWLAPVPVRSTPRTGDDLRRDRLAMAARSAAQRLGREVRRRWRSRCRWPWRGAGLRQLRLPRAPKRRVGNAFCHFASITVLAFFPNSFDLAVVAAQIEGRVDNREEKSREYRDADRPHARLPPKLRRPQA